MTPSIPLTSAVAPSLAPARLPRWLLLLPLCLLVAFVAYLPAMLHAEFLNFDDPFYFGPENAQFVAATAAAKQGGVVAGLGVVLDPRQLVADVYLPVAHASLWLDYWWFDGAPLWPHLEAIVLHAIAGWLLLRFLLALQLRPAVALGTAVLFLLHPALCESVAWVSGRKDVLCGIFVFGQLWLLAIAAQRPRLSLFVGLAAFATLAMYSKATAVVQPLLLLLVAFYTGGSRRRFFAPVVAAAVTVPIALHHQANAAAQGTMVVGAAGDRLRSVPGAFLHYLQTALWPRGLDVLYPEVKTLAAFAELLWPAAIALGLVLLLAVWCWRRPSLRPAGLGILAFFVALLPFNTALPASAIAAADRYLYLPLPFLALAVVLLLAALLRRPAVAAALLAVPLLVSVWGRAPVFASSEALWSASIARDGDNAVALLNLASVIAARAPENPDATQIVPLAERAAAVAQYPIHERRARLLLATFCARENRFEAAALELERAIAASERIVASQPGAASTALLVEALLLAIEPYRQLSRLEAANAALTRATQLLPDAPEVRATSVLLAVDALAQAASAAKSGPPADDDPRVVAIAQQIEAARRLAARDGRIEYAAGLFARLRNRKLEAIKCFRYVVEARPDDVAGWLGAAEVFLDAGMCVEAEDYSRAAIAILRRSGRPIDPRLRLAMARAQRGQGHFDDAIRSLAEYVRQTPRDRDAARLYSGLLMQKAKERLTAPDATHAELQQLVDLALAANPQEPAVDLVRARMLRDQRKYAAAIEALDRLRVALPDFEDTKTMLAENLRDLGYERRFAKDDDGATTAWLRFLAEAPKNVDTDAVKMQLAAIWRHQESAGIAARTRGDRAAAIAAFRDCLRIDPSQHWAAWLLVSTLVDDPAADHKELDELSQKALAWQQAHGLDRSQQVAVRATILGRIGQAAAARQLLDDYLREPDATATAAVLELLRGMLRDLAR